MVTWIKESEDVKLNISLFITQRLLLSMYDSCLENVSDALKWTEAAEIAINEEEINGQEPVQNIRAFWYLLYANKLNILCGVKPSKASENEYNQQI